MPTDLSTCEDWITEMRAEITKLEKEQAQLREISSIVSERHGDDDRYSLPEDEDSDDPEIITIKRIFAVLNGGDVGQDIEVWAAAEHECWSNWMKYMFSKGHMQKNSYGHTGDWCMPKELVDRWQRQMNTSYADLTEKEKQYDRDVVIQYHGTHVNFK